jgi:hypothetical protein
VSTQRAHEHAALNHRLTVIGGVLEDDCRAVLQEFFQARRTGVNAERPRGGVERGAIVPSWRPFASHGDRERSMTPGGALGLEPRWNPGA